MPSATMRNNGFNSIKCFSWAYLYLPQEVVRLYVAVHSVYKLHSKVSIRQLTIKHDFNICLFTVSTEILLAIKLKSFFFFSCQRNTEEFLKQQAPKEVSQSWSCSKTAQEGSELAKKKKKKVNSIGFIWISGLETSCHTPFRRNLSQ